MQSSYNRVVQGGLTLATLALLVTTMATMAAAKPALLSPLLLNFQPVAANAKAHPQGRGLSKFGSDYNADWLRYGRELPRGAAAVTKEELAGAKRAAHRAATAADGRHKLAAFTDFDWSRFGRKRGGLAADFDDYGFGLKFGRR